MAGSLDNLPLLLLLLSLGAASLSLVSGTEGTCEPITIPLCLDSGNFTALYTTTKFPNRHGHVEQLEVIEALEEYRPILDTQCSDTFRKFVCAEYLPPCELYGEEPGYREIYLPCRELCEEARDACEPILKEFRQKRKQNRQKEQQRQRGQIEGRSKGKVRLRWPRAFKCRRNYNSVFASGYCVQG